MKKYSFLFVLLLFGCVQNDPELYTLDDLQREITSICQEADSRRLERLFTSEATPMPREDRRFLKRLMELLKETEFVVQTTEALPMNSDLRLAIIPEPVYYISVAGSKRFTPNEEPAFITFNLFAGYENGRIVLCDVYETAESPESFSQGSTFALIKKESTPHSLGVAKPETFSNSWAGSTFESYSMDNLASLLSNSTGFPIKNLTGIEGDFDFTLHLHNREILSQIKIDLWSVGLDLVFLESLDEKTNQSGEGTAGNRAE